MKSVLLLPRVRVHNANALSSPFTIGFPAMTAWLGAVHALQRHLNTGAYEQCRFLRTGVVCHDFKLHTYRGKGDFVQSIVGTANPVDKEGERPPFIEEARCDLDISLVIEYEGIDMDQRDEFNKTVATFLHSRMKMASGDIIDFDESSIDLHKIANDSDWRRFKRKLMPGYAIIERRDLVTGAMANNPESDSMSVLLDHLKIMHRSHEDDNGEVHWTSSRLSSGWIVPLATGFHGITEIDQAANQRDPDTRHRFAESVVTLGEFVMPYRLTKLDDILWHYQALPEKSLYLCQQQLTSTSL